VRCAGGTVAGMPCTVGPASSPPLACPVFDTSVACNCIPWSPG
jgi:hypothetical protein